MNNIYIKVFNNFIHKNTISILYTYKSAGYKTNKALTQTKIFTSLRHYLIDKGML